MIKKILLTTALVTLSSTAMAGFQFTAPINQNNSSSGMLPTLSGDSPQMPAVPSIQVQQEPVAPQQPQRPVITTREPARIPVQQIINQPVQQQTYTPSVPVIQPSSQPATVTQPSPRSAPQRQASANDLAVGFGKDLPLVTAIRQIVPEGYTYVMDPSIDQGATVSWQGGQEWPSVLEQTVSPMNVAVQVQDKVVRLTKNVPMPAPAPNRQVDSVAWNTPMYQQQQQAQPQPVAQRPMPPQQPQQYAQSNQFASLQASLTQSNYPQTMTDAPMNILAPQEPSIQAQSMNLSSTEPSAVAEKEKSVVPKITQGQWIAQSGSSLKTVLESWSNLEGVDLFWSSDFDYRLAGDVNISGNFEKAVEGLLEGFATAQPKPIGRLHPNLPHGPAVLVIETKQVIN